MVTIYSIIFNEELMLPFMVRFYRKRFPDCRIVLYDNCSTDKTVSIAKKLNCEVINYDTGGKYDDNELIALKNKCWKDATTEWVGVCDCDELVDISQRQLKDESKLGSTIISTAGYTVVNMKNNVDIAGMKHGLRAEDGRFNPPFHPYDKSVFFNKNKVGDINYGLGCHTCAPVGDIRYSDNKYNLYHYKYVNAKKMADRYKLITLSDRNRNDKLSVQFEQDEKNIKEIFSAFRSRSTKIIKHELF